jgi:hypothetical protein
VGSANEIGVRNKRLEILLRRLGSEHIESGACDLSGLVIMEGRSNKLVEQHIIAEERSKYDSYVFSS